MALLVAGCGRGSTAPYTAAATAPCLKAKGFTKVTTDPGKVGFIAGFADNGGVFAVAPGSKNTVTIAFAGDAAGAKGTEDAFRAHARPLLAQLGLLANGRVALLDSPFE